MTPVKPIAAALLLGVLLAVASAEAKDPPVEPSGSTAGQLPKP